MNAGGAFRQGEIEAAISAHAATASPTDLLRSVVALVDGFAGRDVHPDTLMPLLLSRGLTRTAARHIAATYAEIAGSATK